MSTPVPITERQEESLLKALSKEVPRRLQSRLLAWLQSRNGKGDTANAPHTRLDPQIHAILSGLQVPRTCRVIHQEEHSPLRMLLGESVTVEALGDNPRSFRVRGEYLSAVVKHGVGVRWQLGPFEATALARRILFHQWWLSGLQVLSPSLADAWIRLRLRCGWRPSRDYLPYPPPPFSVIGEL